jgi:subtilisin-like proprotein convertase family protein
MSTIRTALSLTFFALLVTAQAQQIAQLKSSIQEVQLVNLPQLDNQLLLQQELAARAPGRPPRFAETHIVDISPATHGKWTDTPSGESVWRLRLRSASAHSLNLGFDHYVMPEGGQLLLFSPDQQRIIGPFTPSNNQPHTQLWTPNLDGEELVIEVQVPTAKRQELQLHLFSVNHDFVGFSQLLSGSCNLDVICGAADGWSIVDHYRDIIQSVGLYALNGNTTCTGFLVNNARNDCTPYFMTAAHCGVQAGNAPSMVVYWNFQNSTCRQPGSPASGGNGDGSLALFSTGSTLRVRHTPTDVVLVELSQPVPEAANAFYAGWNIAAQTPQDTVIAVHHPSLDEKRISFEFDPTYPGSWGSGSTNIPTGNHIVVPDWDIGTTEGGSSGSPLFNRFRQVVGQLHGGAASCNNNSYDSYGWIYYSWLGGGTPLTSLRPWLDPDNTGLQEINGRWARLCSYSVEPLIANRTICAPDTALYPIAVSENFEGPVNLTLTGLPANAVASFSANPASPGDTITLAILNTETITPGSYTFTLTGADTANSNSSFLFLSVNNGIPDAPQLLSPEDGLIGASVAPNFTWNTQQPGTRYEFQLATDPAFSNIVGAVADLSANAITNQVLSDNATFYWRVRATSVCGTGNWSDTRSFTTAVTICSAKTATGLPITIPSSGTPTVNSSIAIAAPGVVAGVKITGLDIRHTWVGDIRARLVSPQGTSVILFDRLGVPNTNFGCNGDNLFLTFYDAAPNTAQQLEGTCSTTPPAASGSFQPVDPLITFAGEPATGTWTLVVNDFVNQDGGSIQAWNLEICTSLPHEAALFPTNTAFNLCVGDTATIEFGIGTAFNGPSVPVQITGASFELSNDNPGPGDILTARVWGFNNAGNVTISLIGGSGQQTDTVAINVNVNTVPDAAMVLAPANNAVNVARNTTLTWSQVPGATMYRVLLSTDSLFSNPSIQEVSANTLSVQNLIFATTYFLRIEAMNECGWSTPAAASRFTVVPDLSFSAGPAAVTTCNTGTATYNINPGPGFRTPFTFSVSATGPGTTMPQLNFTQQGNQWTGAVSNLVFLPRGNYQLSILLSDSLGQTGTATTTLIVQTAPDLPSMTLPANNAVIMTQTPQLSWAASTGANGYTIDIARDDAFSDIVLTTSQAQTTYTVQQPLAAGDYYWRVTATNDCGNATAAPFRFNVMPSAAITLAGTRLQIAPNPTADFVVVQWLGQRPGDWSAKLLSMQGTVLQQRTMGAAEQHIQLDLSAWPAGTYILVLTTGTESSSYRIVKNQ